MSKRCAKAHKANVARRNWINHLFSTIIPPDTFHQCPQPFACHGRKRRPLIAVMLRASLACQFQLNVRCAGSTLHPWHQKDQTRHHWCSFFSNLDMQLERLLSTIQYQCNVVPVCGMRHIFNVSAKCKSATSLALLPALWPLGVTSRDKLIIFASCAICSLSLCATWAYRLQLYHLHGWTA
jgi:hypothetical protein